MWREPGRLLGPPTAETWAPNVVLARRRKPVASTLVESPSSPLHVGQSDDDVIW